MHVLARSRGIFNSRPRRVMMVSGRYSFRIPVPGRPLVHPGLLRRPPLGDALRAQLLVLATARVPPPPPHRLKASLPRPGPAQRMPYPELICSHRDLPDPVQHLQEPSLQLSNVLVFKRHGPRNSRK